MNSCSDCVNVSAKFAVENAEGLSNSLFVFTYIRSMKELRGRFNLEPGSQNFLLDTEDYFDETTLDFNNVGGYILKESEILNKEIFNLGSVFEGLEWFKERRLQDLN